MNKTYKLLEKKRTKDRVVDAIKYDIRKYIKREKNKPLSEGVDFWKMECKISKDSDSLAFVEYTNIIKTIDILVKEEALAINVEILSTKGITKVKEIKTEELVEENEDSEIIEEELENKEEEQEEEK